MELLGVFGIPKERKNAMQEILNQCFVLDFNSEIKQMAIRLKQKYKIKLPDAIIASTSIIYNIPFITADADLSQSKN